MRENERSNQKLSFLPTMEPTIECTFHNILVTREHEKKASGVHSREKSDNSGHHRLASNPRDRPNPVLPLSILGLLQEMNSVFGVYGIEVSKRHLSLTADHMTFTGEIAPFNRGERVTVE